MASHAYLVKFLTDLEGDKPNLSAGFRVISTMKGSMWRHLTPHDAPRPWQRRAMVDRDGFDVGQQQVVLTLWDGAWQWWLD